MTMLEKIAAIKSKNKGFTLIELLVVISIIGLLAGMVLVSMSGARAKARDSRRKQDIRSIRMALELYYANNEKYPQAGACSYGTNCYVYSTDGSNWIPALVNGGFLPAMPVDPINNSCCPWSNGSYSYSYGNVSADGQVFDLTTQLEDSNDPDRCAAKHYKFYWDNYDWCGGYSGQIYENSPGS
jgi:type II secretion system protein G